MGAVAGKLAVATDCRVIGVAGGPDEMLHLIDDLRFHVALGHQAPDIAAGIAKAAPDRVDVLSRTSGLA